MTLDCRSSVGSLALTLALLTGACAADPFTPVPVTELELAPEAPVLMALGATQQLQVVLDGDFQVIDDPSIVWRSSDPAVATVEGAGMVTAMGDGSTIITAELNGITAQTTVTVAATILNTARLLTMSQADAQAQNNSASAAVVIQLEP